MRRFPKAAQLDQLLADGHLEGAHIDALAARIAAFHQRLPPAPVDSPYGRPSDLLQAARDNFTALREGASPRRRARLDRLAAWTEAEYRRCRALLVRRRIDGRVRECHGDLHLGNIVWLDGQPVPFDGIEFDPALRWQDVHGELAFLTMDLARRGRPDLARRVRDRCLQATGDYGGVPLVDFFEVYRALVRAKVARLRAAGALAPGLRFQALRECIGCLRLAETLIRPRRPWLAITHGLAGSGKTHYADWLVEQLPLIRLRSDVERKRLLGLAAAARTGSGIDQGAYQAKVSAATYRHLARLARRLLTRRLAGAGGCELPGRGRTPALHTPGGESWRAVSNPRLQRPAGCAAQPGRAPCRPCRRCLGGESGRAQRAARALSAARRRGRGAGDCHRHQQALCRVGSVRRQRVWRVCFAVPAMTSFPRHREARRGDDLRHRLSAASLP